MSDKPTGLFVCVHNAGRSQMAAGYLQHLAEERIDLAGNQPKVLTTEAVQEADVVITMGCGDECPFFPGKRYEDWGLDDPAGQGIEAVRPVRDDIRQRVDALIAELTSGS